MADFLEVYANFQRMCDEHMDVKSSCEGCPFMTRARNTTCADWMIVAPKRAQQLIMEWAEGHKTTNADKAREIFGDKVPFDFELGNNCGAIICPDHHDCGKCDYANFWKEPYKKPIAE